MSSKREKFINLAEKRVNRAIKDLRLIGNLSNSRNYSYTDADVRKIHAAIADELNKMKARFESGGDAAKPEFKL